MAGLAAYSANQLDIDDVNQLSAIAMVVPEQIGQAIAAEKASVARKPSTLNTANKSYGNQRRFTY